MALNGFVGNDFHQVNTALFYHAAEHLPTLIVDCANFADPYKFYPAIDVWALQNMYVFELELLHKFRDVLRHLPVYARQLNVQSIIVTTADHLINYHDEDENAGIYRHAWQLMKKISRTSEVTAGVLRGSKQYALAWKYCDQLWEMDHGTHRPVTAHGD